MARISFDGFRDPVRRPRYIIWTAAAVLVLAAVVIVALGVTSTIWFCANGCHKVQDDTITAYRHSSHSQISCMACHMPVNSNPVTFVLHKAEALGELYMTVTNNYELPLNGEDKVALEMKPTQCTQCHGTNRAITPTRGILIDHKIHADKGVNCTTCHNRIAHREDFDLALKDPKSGKQNLKHADFMKMTACFRCHSQDAKPGQPTGDCKACHSAGFELKPDSHREAGFYPKGHAELAKAEAKRVSALGGRAFLASGTAGEAETGELRGEELPPVDAINYCSTCHSKKFCTDCHGLPMPHPADFKKGHGDLGKKNPKVCSTCHGDAKKFCDQCHHGTSMKFDIDSTVPWRKQHPNAVKQLGAQTCFECHDPTFCAACHVTGNAP